MFWIELKEFFNDSLKIIIGLIILLLINIYAFSITQIVGTSMSPNYKNKDLLLLNKLAYHFGDIKRGDIVHLTYDNSKYLIKRVIGLPGDHIEIKDSKLYINGEIYEEDYISKSLEYEDFKLEYIGYDVIPKDMYFVLGDNRPDSMDSRKIGLVKKKDIEGKIFFRFWPFNKMKVVK